MTPQKFRPLVWRHWRTQGRHELPWRKTHAAYRVLVSEIMLQQTQVERVIPYYKAFLKKFPTAKALASAPLSEVLKLWQGLGYNRRAKMLHEAAKVVVREHRGRVPTDEVILQKLPGIGPYTARAVAAFAGNRDGILIETNIRTAVIHHFFAQSDSGTVSDKEVEGVLERVHPKGRSGEWYAALMDYGAHLKRSGVRLNTRTKGYKKQSALKGSLREVRGAILRELSQKPATLKMLGALFPKERGTQVKEALTALIAEGLIAKRGQSYQLKD